MLNSCALFNMKSKVYLKHFVSDCRSLSKNRTYKAENGHIVCITHRHFTYFSGVEILWKDTVCRSFHKISPPGN